MGLYISAHPLDKYDKYFEEQTMAFASIKPELDNAKVVIGGIITAVRSILTKSGSKMAFVKVEDKTNELEVIVFPKIFETCGAKLLQDAVIKVEGRVNSTDQNGNQTGEVKIIADTVTIITDDELNDYESTGARLAAPTTGVKRRSSAQVSSGGPRSSYPRPASAPSAGAKSAGPPPPPPAPPKTLYVLLRDPSDVETLSSLKKTCDSASGLTEIILVLGPDKKAMRLPFRVDITGDLLPALTDLLGEDCVKLK